MSLTEYSTNLSASFLFDSMEAFKKRCTISRECLTEKYLKQAAWWSVRGHDGVDTARHGSRVAAAEPSKNSAA
jgi:hypothetical protein